MMHNVLLIILLLVAIAAWVALVQVLYPLRGQRPMRLTATTTDGWSLAIWHRPAVARRFREPVVLCHGLANNHAFLEFQEPQNLAGFLSGLGFECYSVDLRGAGASRPPIEGPFHVTIDDHVNFDVPAIAELVTRHAGSRELIWVGHSLGGLVGLAAAGTTLGPVLKALVTIASPAFFHTAKGTTALLKLGQWLAPWGQFGSNVVRYVSPLAGWVTPASLASSTNLQNIDGRSQRYLLANVFAPIWRGVMAQLEDWVRTNSFRSVDRLVDYRAPLASLRCPVLVVGGSVDLLSPEPATKQLFEALPPASRSLALFGRKHGHHVDYGHGDLVIGRRAHEEVYPVIGAFLAGHATGVEVPLPVDSLHA